MDPASGRCSLCATPISPPRPPAMEALGAKKGGAPLSKSSPLYVAYSIRKNPGEA